MRSCLIVTTYNWPDALHLTLASVARQSQLPDEVVIADDGSGPATRDRRRALARGRPAARARLAGRPGLPPRPLAQPRDCEHACRLHPARRRRHGPAPALRRRPLALRTTGLLHPGRAAAAVGRDDRATPARQRPRIRRPADARPAATRVRDAQPAAQPRLLPHQGHARRRAGLQPVLLAQPRRSRSTATTSASRRGARKTASSSHDCCTWVCAATTCAIWQLPFICITRPAPRLRRIRSIACRRKRSRAASPGPSRASPRTWTASSALRRDRARAAPLRCDR